MNKTDFRICVYLVFEVLYLLDSFTGCIVKTNTEKVNTINSRVILYILKILGVL
jgi:hypothetical protein